MVARIPLLLVAVFASAPAISIDRVVLDFEDAAVGDARVAGATVTLDLTPEAPTARIAARQVTLTRGMAALRNVRVDCGTLIVKEPVFACRSARVNAQGGPTGPFAMRAALEYNTEASALTFEGSELAMAGGKIRFAGRMGASGWSIDTDVAALNLPDARKLAAPWLSVPATYTFDGKLDLHAKGSGRGDSGRMQLDARIANANFSNEASTVVAEKVAAALRGNATLSRTGVAFDAEFESGAGQALGGPVFLDLAANPMKVTARGTLKGETLELSSLTLAQRNVVDASARATLSLGEKTAIDTGHVEIARLIFPGAYTSFMQLRLATTDFGALQIAGSASGSADIASNRITRVDAQLNQLAIEDDKGKFSMADVQGMLHWALDANAAVEPSRLEWSRGNAYGLAGGATRIDFTTRGRGIELAPNARIPIFDGAIVLNTFRLVKPENAELELDFDARLEPISMPLLSRAFGWPELSGQLSGQIPGVTYRNRELTVDGDLVASVFDGQIVGRGFRLRDPLGPWPRLFADVTARRLDLALVTNTFSIGSITGRLDADIKGLELFNWSPVAFDARLYSTPGDRSKHLISQKAINSISSVGGGWGGVPAALQSGVLRFFDDFRYDRIGLTCQLRNEICLMGGIEEVRGGYYIVKGGGLPRIDIIGNSGRVDWPDLISRIVAGMKSGPSLEKPEERPAS